MFNNLKAESFLQCSSLHSEKLISDSCQIAMTIIVLIVLFLIMNHTEFRFFNNQKEMLSIPHLKNNILLYVYSSVYIF